GPGALPNHGPTEPADPDPDRDQLDQAQRLRQLVSHQASTVTLPQAILNRLLKEFMQDEQATFRSLAQARALHALLTKVPYLILILPTAGGKTTLFLLGASLAISQTTILVAPLVALKMDLYRKAQALGLSVRIYEDGYDQGSIPRILLVSIESLAMPRFYSYTRTLAAQGQLDRVIFDECHLIPLAQSYRQVMHRVKQVMQLPVPMVFSSATLPKHLETELRSMMMISQAEVIRANINKPNLQYGVQLISQNSEYPEALIQFMKHFEWTNQNTTRPLKIIVFCMSKALVEALHSQYPETYYFHADLPDPVKSDQLDRFIQAGQGQAGQAAQAAQAGQAGQAGPVILMATGAIGAGFDFSDISLIIHLQGAWSFTDFMQES
ncbi:P-loop containing nucleoside triphosphate hydrolase protein, partial [Aspergillus alliaceus]